jgi:hypothetical protein
VIPLLPWRLASLKIGVSRFSFPPLYPGLKSAERSYLLAMTSKVGPVRAPIPLSATRLYSIGVISKS